MIKACITCSRTDRKCCTDRTYRTGRTCCTGHTVCTGHTCCTGPLTGTCRSCTGPRASRSGQSSTCTHGTRTCSTQTTIMYTLCCLEFRALRNFVHQTSSEFARNSDIIPPGIPSTGIKYNTEFNQSELRHLI